MKKFLYVIIGLVVIYFILAFIGPKHIDLSRQIEINKDKQFVLEKLNDLQFFQAEWSPWTKYDPKMNKEIIGTPGSVGHQLSWKSEAKEIQQGTLTMVAYPQDSIIQSFAMEGMGNPSKTYYAVNSLKENSTTLTWGMSFDVGFFQRPIMLFMNFDKMIGPDYEEGLKNFKNKVEVMPTVQTTVKYKVEELSWEETSYVGKKITIKFNEIAAYYGKEFPALYTAIEKSKLAPQSAPTSIVTMYDEANQKMEMAASFKVAKNTKLAGYETFNFAATKVLKVAYYGAYEKTQPAHMAIDAYMKEKKLTNGAVFEEYVTDPMVEKDTAKWLTNIYYLVK